MRVLRPALAAVLVLLAILVAGCSGGGETAAPTATEAPEATQPVATQAPTPKPGVHLSTEEVVRVLRPSVVQVLTEDAARDIFGRAVPSRGIGTGVIIDTEGHILTNNHVVRVGGEASGRIARSITVTLFDGRTAVAQAVGTDIPTDLAVVKIDASGLTPATLGAVSTLAVGADVVAMGYALGLEGAPTVTRGVVSAKNRTIQEDPYSIPDAIQTDASINPGNSGGPLVDDGGRVVGINTAIIQGAQSIGFSISIDIAGPISEELIQNGIVTRSYMGIGFDDVTPSLAAMYGLAVDSGVAVTQVERGSPAAEAGLQPNDIIVGLQDEEIANSGQLLEALRVYKPGEQVAVRFYRDGEEQQADLTLGEPLQ